MLFTNKAKSKCHTCTWMFRSRPILHCCVQWKREPVGRDGELRFLWNNCKSYINFFLLAKWSFWKPNIWVILTINLPVLIAISSHLSFHSQNVNISSLSWGEEGRVNIRLIESFKSANVIIFKEKSFITAFISPTQFLCLK